MRSIQIIELDRPFTPDDSSVTAIQILHKEKFVFFFFGKFPFIGGKSQILGGSTERDVGTVAPSSNVIDLTLL
jgi:hypothetical protein